MKENRVFYFDYLRILAIIAVVILHTSGHNWYHADVLSFEWHIFNFFDGSARWSVPIFVMISGALFLDRTLPIKKLYLNNILRLILVLVFWSTFYAIWDSVVFGKHYSIKELITEILYGHYHLWFLFMIIGLYIVVPILRRIVLSKHIAVYFVIVSWIFAFLIPQFIEVLSFKYNSISTIIEKLITNLQLHMILGYSCYFVLGYLLNKFELKRKQKFTLYVFSVLGFIFTIIATAFFSILNKTPTTVFYDNFTLNIFFVAVGIFVFAKSHFNNPRLLLFDSNIISFLSKSTFGVYLIHPLFIESLDKLFNITTLSFNPLLSVPILSFIVFSISLLLSVILNKIPFIKTWLV